MNVISIGIYLEFDNFETRGKMDRRRTDGTSTGAIAYIVNHLHADQVLYAAGLLYYSRIKTQIKCGRPKLNWICRGLDARRGMARARRRRMALIDRETISILLYVFINSRPFRRFNIGTSTWDECCYSGAEGVGIANPCRGWGRERNRPVRDIGMDGEKGARGTTVRTQCRWWG